MIRSSVGRLRHKIRKFPVEIFHNANNRPQTLRQILRMVTIDIAIKLTLMAVLCTRYVTRCQYCIAFEAMLFSTLIIYYRQVPRSGNLPVYFYSVAKKTFCPLAEKL